MWKKLHNSLKNCKLTLKTKYILLFYSKQDVTFLICLASLACLLPCSISSFCSSKNTYINNTDNFRSMYNGKYYQIY